jgi:hypothetical protein
MTLKLKENGREEKEKAKSFDQLPKSKLKSKIEVKVRP